MKYKYLKIIIIIFMSIILIIPFNAEAKTLGELKEEYNALEEKYNETEEKKEENEEETAAAKERIESIYDELESASKEIQEITNEIAKLNESISEKEEQTKELMKFFQVSEGESTYLEYIFSADSITDFIYRISVTEQLSKYNNQLIDDMNNMITENNKNIENLHKKEESLKSLQTELNEKLEVLASEKETLYEESLSTKEELDASKSILDYYVSAGCKDNDDISSCSGDLPPGTKFYRPVTSGCITSNYGMRYHPISKVYKLHTGIDISCGDRKIYSVSDGKVAFTGSGDGYGNYIVIYHYINGKKYSSLYAHLAAIYVTQGDIVTKDTVIGKMGTTGNSTGIHLHLNIYVGLYLKVGESYTLVDPRNYINFPTYNGGSYSYFYNRTSYYN